jgi:hypothetical protein
MVRGDRTDAGCQAGRGWIHEAIERVEADGHRSADTHLLSVPLPREWGVDLYLKDESTHPTGSLKHRLARSLFLYALCNGWIREGLPVIEASSGSTAVSEAYFARMLDLPFIAVMPASTSKEKCALIEFYGGRCHLVADPTTVVAESKRLAAETSGHFMDQFTYAERGYGLARQQQHRRVDIRPDVPRTAPDPVLGGRRRGHRRHERDHRALRPVPEIPDEIVRGGSGELGLL